MAFDSLPSLRQAGHPVDQLPASQRAVLAQLSESEVTLLNTIKQRLDAAQDSEVEGQLGAPIGAVVF